jgi:hypothetical protein
MQQGPEPELIESLLGRTIAQDSNRMGPFARGLKGT